MRKIVVDELNIGERLDSYIAGKEEDLTRTAVKKLIEDGNIKVNNNIQKNSYKVRLNDIIEIDEPEVKDINIHAQNIPIEVVYEDSDIIVVNKPKGLVVHPANGNWDGTLVNAIMAICKDSLSGIGGEIRPGIVHRLDKDTSGLLIVAKNDKSHIDLSQQIKDRKVRKVYYALVRGVVPENEATINMPIARSKKDRKKMAVDKNGKEAITHFQVLKRYEGFTLLEVKIETGRTHQIRSHMKYIGHPVLGDVDYGGSDHLKDIKFTRQMLHSYRVRFTHPVTSKEMEFIAPLPEDMKVLFKNIKI